VSISALVPILGGAWGAWRGLGLGTAIAESHAHYLSGVLLGIGLMFWACVPSIERRSDLVRRLAIPIVIGGLVRLAAVMETGLNASIALPLIMELGVTPTLVLWVARVSDRLRERSGQGA
jgi:hypothetical protein